MADDGYDFFAPQPKPKPRQKSTMFEVVPDAFTPKTLEFTGDHRRAKPSSDSEKSHGKMENGVEREKADGVPVPVEETMNQDVADVVSAQMWEGVSDYCCKPLDPAIPFWFILLQSYLESLNPLPDDKI